MKKDGNKMKSRTLEENCRKKLPLKYLKVLVAA